jgi:hypothetical protein
MRVGTQVYLKGDTSRPGLVCAVQLNLVDKSEPAQKYWVLWRDCKKTDHTIDQLEVRKTKGKYEI